MPESATRRSVFDAMAWFRRVRSLPIVASVVLHALIVGLAMHTREPPTKREPTTRPPQVVIRLIEEPELEPVRETTALGTRPRVAEKQTRSQIAAPIEEAHTKGVAPPDTSSGSVLAEVPATHAEKFDPMTVRLSGATPSRAPDLLGESKPSATRSDTPESLMPSGEGSFEVEGRGFNARVQRDGSIVYRDPPKALRVAGAVYETIFNLDPAALLDELDGNTYASADKLKFMSETRAFRDVLCDRDRSERLREAIPGLRSTLEVMWSREGATLAARKEALFRLWDSCSEESDPELEQATRMARAVIIEFIRDRLPEEGTGAFSQTELVALNDRRVSKARFDPYRD